MGDKRTVVVFGPGMTEIGGAAQRTRLILEGFRSSGWEVRFVGRAGTLWKPRIARREGSFAIDVPGFGQRSLGRLVFLMVSLPLAILWRRRADAVVTIQILSQILPASIAAGRGIPFLALSTTSGRVSEFGHIKTAPFLKRRIRLLQRVTRFVAQSPISAAEIEDLVPGADVRILANPVELKDAPELNGEPAAMFAGRFSSEKGLLDLADAWPAVIEQFPAARLTLLGSGGAYRSIEGELRERVSALGLQRSVEMPGWVPDAPDWLARIDVFVLPSEAEGLSNALLEACAMGRVIVASDIPPNRWLLGDDYPLLFEAGSVSELADRILSAFRDDQTRRIARAKALEAVAELGSDRFMARLIDVIDETATRR